VDAATYQKVRPSFELSQSSGALLIRPAVRTSNDGLRFDQPVAIGAATRNTDGTTYGASFTDLTGTTDSKRLVQPGIEANNDSGSSLEMGLGTLKLDRRGV
jgi:hypothetical protein